jgi:hypothetical protein
LSNCDEDAGCGGIDEFVAFLARQLPAWGLYTTVMYERRLSGGGRAYDGRLAATLRSEGVSVIDALCDGGRQWLAVNRPDTRPRIGYLKRLAF